MHQGAEASISAHDAAWCTSSVLIWGLQLDSSQIPDWGNVRWRPCWTFEECSRPVSGQLPAWVAPRSPWKADGGKNIIELLTEARYIMIYHDILSASFSYFAACRSYCPSQTSRVFVCFCNVCICSHVNIYTMARPSWRSWAIPMLHLPDHLQCLCLP